MSENQNFFRFIKSRDLVLVAIHEGKILYSDKIDSYYDASLGVQDLESFLLSFLHFNLDTGVDLDSNELYDEYGMQKKIRCKNVTSFQLNSNSAIIVIGKLKHSEEECEQLSIMMKKLHMTPSNKTISLIIGLKWNPSEIVLKRINKVAFPEPESNQQTKSKPVITVSQRTSRSTILPVVALIITASLLLVSQYDAFAAYVCDGIVDVAYGNLDFDAAKNCNEIVLNKYPDDHSALQWKPIIEDALKNLPIIHQTPGTAKQLNDRADSTNLDARSSLVLYHVVYVRDNLNSRALNGIANSLVDIDKKFVEQVYTKDEFELDLQHIPKYAVANEYYKKTERIYEKAPPENGVPNAIIGQGTILFKEVKLNDALLLFNKGLDVCEKESSILGKPISDQACFSNGNNGIGFVFLRQNNYVGAGEKFDLVLKHDPDNLVAQIGKAFYYLAVAENDEDKIKISRDLFAKVLQKKPILINAIIEEAMFFSGIEEKSLVNSLYDDVLLELFPENDVILNGKGLSLLMMNKPGEAVDHYKDMLEKYPQSNSLLVGYAEVLFQEGDYPQALILYQRVLNNDPENEAAFEGIEKTKSKI